MHSTRGLGEISQSEIYHRDFDLARKFPPSCNSHACICAVCVSRRLALTYITDCHAHVLALLYNNILRFR